MASIDPTRTNSELDLLIDMYVSCDYDMRFNFHQFQLIFNGGGYTRNPPPVGIHEALAPAWANVECSQDADCVIVSYRCIVVSNFPGFSQ